MSNVASTKSNVASTLLLVWTGPYAYRLVCSAPPEFDSPTFDRVVSDTEMVVLLYPASSENGDITHYYVVVVPDELTHGRRPDDFKIDEVPDLSLTYLRIVMLSCVCRRL